MDDPFCPIDGFPGYRVSRDGEVESCWNRRGRRGGITSDWLPVEPIRTGSGHLFVHLHRDGEKTTRYIHHLVLETFVGPRPAGTVCCHWDGDPSNNRLGNLRWGTPRENSHDTLRHGRRKFGEEAGSKLSEGDVLEIRRQHASGVPTSRLADEFGVTSQNVTKIVQRRTWKHLA